MIAGYKYKIKSKSIDCIIPKQVFGPNSIFLESFKVYSNFLYLPHHLYILFMTCLLLLKSQVYNDIIP